jgi:hypothetical protein
MYYIFVHSFRHGLQISWWAWHKWAAKQLENKKTVKKHHNLILSPATLPIPVQSTPSP